MSFLGKEYDQSQIPQSQGYDPIPAGWYQAKIVSAEVKESQKGGAYLNIRYDIIGPTHQGRAVFGMITIRNANKTAEDIGEQQLGDLMRSIGIGRLSDSDQLVGGTMEIKVSVKPGTEQYPDPKNEIKGWKAIATATFAQTQAPAQQQQQPQAPQQASAPPWAQR